MPKIFNYLKTSNIQSQEIVKLVEKANQLTDGDGYQLYDTNAESLCRVLDKILILAKQEKEWYCYFVTFYKMFYLLDRTEQHKKILKYAEIFYHDCTLYFEQAVASYPDVNVGEYSTLSYDMIYSTYKKFPQIDDEKMNRFMETFRETVYRYGSAKEYYSDMLKLALLYRDVDMARQNKEILEQFEIKNCYLCAVNPIIGYYLLCEDYEQAENMMEQIRTRSIPKQHLWCYTHCYLSEDKELIMSVLGYCMMLGKSEYFHKLLQENRELFTLKTGKWETYEACYYLCVGELGYLEEHIERTERDVRAWKNQNQSALGHLYDCLCWYCYFTRLDRNGIKSVKTNLAVEAVPANSGGECDCLLLAAYFEREADKLGAQMEESRKKFDYMALKRSYEECLLDFL